MKTILKWMVLCVLIIVTRVAQAGLFGNDGPLDTNGLSYLKTNGIQQLVVPYFKINVHTKLNKTEQSRSGLFGGGKATAKSSMFTEWKDPDLKMLQQVADDAWIVFVKELTAAGFEIVPMHKMIASEAFKKINGSTEPEKDEKMVSLVPKGMKLYDPSGKIDPNGSFFLGMGDTNQKLEYGIAREILGDLKNVAVVRITLNLAYGAFETEADAHTALSSFDRDSASVKVAFVPVVSVKPASPTHNPEYSRMQFASRFVTDKMPNGEEIIWPKDFSYITLREPLLGEKKVSTLEDITTTGEKAAAASVALIGLLAGQGASLEVGNYLAKVDSKAFAAEAHQQITRLAGMVGQKIVEETKK